MPSRFASVPLSLPCSPQRRRWRSRPIRSPRSEPTTGRTPSARPRATPTRSPTSWSPITASSRQAPRRPTRSATSWRRARLAESGAAGAAASGGDRHRSRPRFHAGAVRPQPTHRAADHAALRRGAGERRPQRGGSRRGAPRLDRRRRRRARLPAPLVGRRAP